MYRRIHDRMLFIGLQPVGRYQTFDPGADRLRVRLIICFLFELAKLLKELFLVKFDRFPDMDQFVGSLLQPFLLHEHLLIEFLAGS